MPVPSAELRRTPTSSAAAPRPRRSAARRVLLGALLPLAILAAWWTVSATGAVPAYRLPSPPQVLQAAVELQGSSITTLAEHVQISVQRILIGFVLGSAAGLVLGAVVGLSRLGDAVLGPTLGALRAVPSLALLPLIVLYLGINEDQKVLLIAVGAAFPVYTTTAAALRHVDAHLVELGRAYGLTPFELFRTVQLPAALPSVVSGLRLALAQSWLFLVAAELFSSMGLGFLLFDSGNNGRIDRLFLAIILLAVLGKASDALVGLGERTLLRRWT